MEKFYKNGLKEIVPGSLPAFATFGTDDIEKVVTMKLEWMAACMVCPWMDN